MWSLKKQASHSMPMPMPMSLRSAVPEMHLLMLRRPPLVYDIRRYSSPIPSPSSRKASHRDVRRESVSSTARSLGPRCAYSYYADYAQPSWRPWRAFLRLNVHVTQATVPILIISYGRYVRYLPVPTGTCTGSVGLLSRYDQIATGTCRYARYLPVNVHVAACCRGVPTML